MKDQLSIIAFYLPQFHPTKNNDKWWGAGFTEWTNVGRAKPLFKGHDQPKVPADLGYYDLRIPEVREKQAQLAREAGIGGFCYYHYWFDEHHQELDLPFNEVLHSGKPDFPFCLCWANESWHKKFWNPDGSFAKETLAEQKYEDARASEVHFYSLLAAFKDERYIKVDGKPLFMIYKPLDFKNIDSFILQWNTLARQNGFEGIHFVGHSYEPSDVDTIIGLGFDRVCMTRTWEPYRHKFNHNTIRGFVSRMIKRLLSIPFVIKYDESVKYLIGPESSREDVYPVIVPNWDHTPRSKKGGFVFHNSTPDKFKEHASDVISKVVTKKSNKIIFLKSWNEWGEGNYMEPDLKWGKAYIQSLRDALKLKSDV